MRETFLAALFLWYTPLEAAALIAEIAAGRAALAAAASLLATAVSTFLIAVFTAERIDLFLSAFVLFTRILFFADLIFAILLTSNNIIHNFHQDQPRHGQANLHIRI